MRADIHHIRPGGVLWDLQMPPLGAQLYRAVVSDKAPAAFRKQLAAAGCACKSVGDILARAEDHVSGRMQARPVCAELLAQALLATYNAMGVSRTAYA